MRHHCVESLEQQDVMEQLDQKKTVSSVVI